MTPMMSSRPALFALALSLVTGVADAEHAAGPAQERLLEVIAGDFRATAYLTGLRSMSPAVAAAMRAVPRERFVRPGDADAAYDNRPLSIGHGQTISQPFIVALMSELAQARPGQRVLEIGTGSGYQAAILAELGAEVWTVEIIPELSIGAGRVLAELGYGDVHLRVGNGREGWSEAAPFDAILVTAGGDLPRALVDQLAPAGRLIIPLDRGGGEQVLMLYRRGVDETLEAREVLPVRFVPLVGDESPR
ncbi:MAG: protein-L-isoaspartate(D-aspartate) O-methyltransferase [Gammaproteobacteria bacterium]